MRIQAFFTTAANAARALSVVGEHITVQASGDMTGSCEVFLQEGPEGSRPIPHTHPWDESFFALRGEVEFSVDRSALRAARPGGPRAGGPPALVPLEAGRRHAVDDILGGRLTTVRGLRSRNRA